METSKTLRGFKVSEFQDFNGEKCSLQESSIATDYCIWLGVEDPSVKAMVGGTGPWEDVPLPKYTLISSRMHLSREQVAELLPALQHFVKTGELP